MGADDKIIHPDNAFLKFVNFCIDLVEKPVVWFRETVVEPNRQEYYWYHEKVRRVPTVDHCYPDDAVCIYEADIQFDLDRQVDAQIINILRKRYERCLLDNPKDTLDCEEMNESWQKAVNNYFIKYGDLGARQKSIACLMKQKHRMAWERRHGAYKKDQK